MSETPVHRRKGSMTESVKAVLHFLQQVQANRAVTERACAALQAEGLIQPWPVTLKSGQGEKTVQGLYRIDEDRLNGLGAEALQRLQQAGALSVAYCQLLSMQHLQMLGQLAAAHANANAQAQSQQALPTTPSGEIDLEFLNHGGTLSFGAH